MLEMMKLTRFQMHIKKKLNTEIHISTIRRLMRATWNVSGFIIFLSNITKWQT